MQRKSHLLAETVGLDGSHTARSPLFVIGLIVYISAAVPDTLAWSMLPQVVCATTETTRLPLVAILANRILDEPFTMKACIGLVTCLLGTTMCIWLGPRQDTSEETVLSKDLTSPTIKSYLALGSVLILALFLIEHANTKNLAPAQGILRFTLPLLFSLTFGIQKVINTELGFVSSADHRVKWILMVVAMAVLALLNLYTVLRAAKKLPAKVMVFMSFAFNMVIQIFQSVVLFNEFDGMDLGRSMLVLIGLLMAFGGAVYVEMGQVADGVLKRMSELGEDGHEIQSADQLELQPMVLGSES